MPYLAVLTEGKQTTPVRLILFLSDLVIFLLCQHIVFFGALKITHLLGYMRVAFCIYFPGHVDLFVVIVAIGVVLVVAVGGCVNVGVGAA